jgi:uncharacterized membrane protein
MILFNIIQIAFLCITIGVASIPVSFAVNSNPFVVWIGNALGSLVSAFVVIYIGHRITDKQFKAKISKRRVGKKVVTVFDEGEDNHKVQKVRVTINKRGLRVFSFFTPVFPGVLISTVAVFLLGLDLHTYKKWMFPGIFFASGAYVFGYWWVFVR